MTKRLKLVVVRWYDLLELLSVVAQEGRIVADQNNHWNTVAELRQDLFDEPRVGVVEAGVNCSKRFVKRRELPCFGELTMSVRVRELHGFTLGTSLISGTVFVVRHCHFGAF